MPELPVPWLGGDGLRSSRASSCRATRGTASRTKLELPKRDEPLLRLLGRRQDFGLRLSDFVNRLPPGARWSRGATPRASRRPTLPTVNPGCRAPQQANGRLRTLRRGAPRWRSGIASPPCRREERRPVFKPELLIGSALRNLSEAHAAYGLDRLHLTPPHPRVRAVCASAQSLPAPLPAALRPASSRCVRLEVNACGGEPLGTQHAGGGGVARPTVRAVTRSPASREPLVRRRLRLQRGARGGPVLRRKRALTRS